MLVLGQRDARLVLRRLCRRCVHGVRRDVRVYASDRFRRLDDRGERGLFRGLPALAKADARAYDGSAFAGPDVAAVARADHAADMGALAGAHDGAAHAEAVAVADAPADAGPHAGADAPTRQSHGGAGLCSDATAHVNAHAATDASAVSHSHADADDGPALALADALPVAGADAVPVCVEINQSRHRAGVASMAWRSTRRFSADVS